MHIKYYQEQDGGYLQVIHDRAYQGPGGCLSARGAVISGLASSMATMSVAPHYLSECKWVRKAAVPVAWLQRF